MTGNVVDRIINGNSCAPEWREVPEARPVGIFNECRVTPPTVPFAQALEESPPSL
jgi:hypothetical protein